MPPQPAEPLQRWRAAVTLVLETQKLQRQADILQCPKSRPRDRFAAAVWLAMQNTLWSRLLARNPHKHLLVEYVAKKRAGQFASVWDRIDTELYLTGALIFEWCTPARMGQHWTVFTLLFFLAEWSTFFFMAGQFPYFMAYTRHHKCMAALRDQQPITDITCPGVWMTTTLDWQYMVEWIVNAPSSPHEFNFSFMRAWGGRYAPDIASGHAYRWFTAQFVHINFQHILSNMLLFVFLSGLMEAKYGSARIIIVWFVSVLGGAFLSCALENPCIQVVGCSGGCFGLFGLFIADMVLNFESVRRPILRSLCIIAFLCYFLYTAFSQAYVSHISHIGGLVCGLFPAFLCLPHLSSERWEALLPLIGVSAVLGVFVALPVWLYKIALPDTLILCPTVT
eukprot:jgi/Chrzof1/924/Cz01g33230.t1